MFVISNEHSIHQLFERFVYICLYLYEILLVFKESNVHSKKKFEDTKDGKSKDRQHNGQKKKHKRTNNDLQNIHIKLKIE